METALNEITLVLFTTLAPAGAVAYLLMALPIIVSGPTLEPMVRRKLDQFLCIPIVVAMVGLIASATHLGNPANALYVVTGFGRSPLSNEVVCGAVFLGAAGVFWLTAFSVGPDRLALRRVLAAIISVLGLVFIGAISLAYDADTIITWSTPFAPITTWLNAVSAGPLLALLGMRAARFYTPHHRLGRGLVMVAAVALIASIVAYAVWGASLPQIHNALSTASELAPAFLPSIGLFAVLGASSLLLGAKTVWWRGEAPLRLPILAVVLMLVAIFIMRFQFYMIHMTVGV